MNKPESVDDSTSHTAEEYTSGVTIKNARNLTECVEDVASTVERLEDPATFQVTLNRYKPVD